MFKYKSNAVARYTDSTMTICHRLQVLVVLKDYYINGSIDSDALSSGNGTILNISKP
jgi:hypothetical protein